MKERYTVRMAVLLLLERIDENSNKRQILLQKRQNTGYMDNMYDAQALNCLEIVL